MMTTQEIVSSAKIMARVPGHRDINYIVYPAASTDVPVIFLPNREGITNITSPALQLQNMVPPVSDTRSINLFLLRNEPIARVQCELLQSKG